MLSKLYKHNLALLTDLYQMTMAYGYWKNGKDQKESVFHLYYRKNPFGGDYAVACGLDLVIDYLNNFKFERKDLYFLARLKDQEGNPLFEDDFLEYLATLKFECCIDAVKEGTLIFANQPLLRVKGPLLQAQLIETALLNMINFSTLIATKASRIVKAAENDPVLEFGLRRAQGIDGGISASRAAYIGGCSATSNVLAGQLFNIPVKGTHAHSWVMCFEDEIDAFEKYANTMPSNCIFLVDTYDTIEGVENAIKVGVKLRSKGYRLNGIRLDSGDLADLSKKARKLLDGAGFYDAKIVATNDLNENKIKELKKHGAKIDVWGVGTQLSTAYDQAALGGVYKLAALKNEVGNWEYKIKRSEQLIKTSTPGIQQIKRCYKDGRPAGDIVFNILDHSKQLHLYEDRSGHFISLDANRKENLLTPVFRYGELVYNSPSATDIRNFAKTQISLFSKTDLSSYSVGLDPKLFKLKSRLIKNTKRQLH